MPIEKWLQGADNKKPPEKPKIKPGFTGVGIRPEDIDTEADGSPCRREPQQPVSSKE